MVWSLAWVGVHALFAELCILDLITGDYGMKEDGKGEKMS
jgi:hypothetical protein